jgi:hypothetical protein
MSIKKGFLYMKKKLSLRKKRSLETKKTLYANSIKLFNEKGYDNVTVDEIVGVSGFAKGTFYTHFSSKDEIIKNRIKELDDFYTNIFRYINKKNSPEKKMIIFVQELYKQIEYKIGLDFQKISYQNLIGVNSVNNEVFQINEDRSLYKIIYQIIQEGQKKGEFTKDLDYREIGMLIIRNIRGTVFEWCIYGEKMNLRKEGMIFLNLFLDSIRTK